MHVLSLPRLHQTLASVPPGSKVTLEMAVDFIDHAAYQAVDEWRRQHEAGGGTVVVQEVGAVEMGSAVTGPPSRAFTGIDTRLGVAPWSSWQSSHSHPGHDHRDAPPRAMLAGLEVYHRRMAPYIARTWRTRRHAAGRDVVHHLHRLTNRAECDHQ